jgi:hypothetical protein
MQSLSDWLQGLRSADQLLWADFLPHCPGLVVPASHAKNSQNIGVIKMLALAKISLIFAKL